MRARAMYLGEEIQKRYSEGVGLRQANSEVANLAKKHLRDGPESKNLSPIKILWDK
jgi:hypothetical protein